MKLERSKDPTLCAGKNGTRYDIAGFAGIEWKGNGYVATTDGRMLTMLRSPLEDSEVDEKRSYPCEAFKMAKQAAPRGQDVMLTLGKEGAKLLNGALVPPNEQGCFPQVSGVIPSGAPVLEIHFDAALLAKIQKALGATHGVSVQLFSQPGSDDRDVGNMPMIVKPAVGYEDDGSFGVLMPLAAEAKNRG